jgi:sigma-B regulation protein RsbU (phosphoserine phosphatase)
MNVLVIGDQPVAALQMVAALRSLGRDPLHVSGGEEAWRVLAAENAPRVIVSDWRMPGLDGLELCRRIRDRAGDYVYFILVSTAGVTPENRDAALAAGVDDFLAKPLHPDELRMRLHVAERILKFTAQVNQLESFLPICGYCKKIRDDRNYWAQVEDYYAKRDGTHFSHSVCPDCYEKEMVPQLKKLGIVPPGGEQKA